MSAPASGMEPRAGSRPVARRERASPLRGSLLHRRGGGIALHANSAIDDQRYGGIAGLGNQLAHDQRRFAAIGQDQHLGGRARVHPIRIQIRHQLAHEGVALHAPWGIRAALHESSVQGLGAVEAVIEPGRGGGI